MKTKNGPSAEGPTGPPDSPRTLIPNGPLVAALRKSQGLRREEFAWQSHLAVERAAGEGRDDRSFQHRFKAKSKQGKLAGIGTTALRSVENSNRVYLITLKIVAETLGVSVQSIMELEQSSRVHAATSYDADSTEKLIEELVRLLREDGRSVDTGKLMKMLRILFERLFPP